MDYIGGPRSIHGQHACVLSSARPDRPRTADRVPLVLLIPSRSKFRVSAYSSSMHFCAVGAGLAARQQHTCGTGRARGSQACDITSSHREESTVRTRPLQLHPLPRTHEHAREKRRGRAHLHRSSRPSTDVFGRNSYMPAKSYKTSLVGYPSTAHRMRQSRRTGWPCYERYRLSI